MFNHLNYLQPKSVIENNVYTHLNSIDKSSTSKGFKHIVRLKEFLNLMFMTVI